MKPTNSNSASDNNTKNEETWGRTDNESYVWEKDGHQEHHNDNDLMKRKRSDERIENDIRNRMSDDNFLDASKVEITVMDGAVTITGTVPEENDKLRAEDVAGSISGVLSVENQIRVDDTEKPSDEHHYKTLMHSSSSSPKSIF